METISSYLAGEHTRCDALFDQAQVCVLAAQWPEAALAFERFELALDRHLAMEETIVFPAFEHAMGGAAGPTGVMRKEHLQIRGVVQRLNESIGHRQANVFFDHADTFRILLHQHSEKEEGVLYPMAERVLCSSQDQLIASMKSLAAMHAGLDVR